MKKNYQTWCPLFPGFYGSVFEYDNEESDIESYNEEYKTDYDYDDFNWDYADYHKRVSIAFVNKLECELKHLIDVTIDFEELRSPKEYNFTNDSINVTVKLDLKKLIKLVKERKEQATQYFKDRYTSCSGFISFHSNDIEDWLNEAYILEKEAHRVGALLDCLASIEIDKDDIIYWADDQHWIDMWPKNEVEAN